MAEISTRQKLLSLIEDVELISKELFEVSATPKSQQKPDAMDSMTLVELVTMKDKEIKETLKLAAEQAEIQKTIEELRAVVDRRDAEIKHLQKNLKEAETILSTAIYQAKQKLTAINQANNRKISSEELIKFAHRISASNAVASPPTWAPGDPRRPYPTDFEMRLGKVDLPLNTPLLQSQGSYGEPMSSNRSSTQDGAPTSSASGWHSSSESMLGASGTSHILDMKGHKTETDDVEFITSGDSSSSSLSSDE
ncbi:mediator of RNA polymerase II transcription subunit 4-like [Ostrea edulis]|uniref:mediator of RNA polymerase II transcription subunit 4-like n=1 Tax=Ostrea edulis TaxID=37623 RepID=UPI0020958A50|nr:mediator of RNA polymerase II transcription subunit 4-like [Ostrea edulis]